MVRELRSFVPAYAKPVEDPLQLTAVLLYWSMRAVRFMGPEFVLSPLQEMWALCASVAYAHAVLSTREGPLPADRTSSKDSAGPGLLELTPEIRARERMK